MLPEGFIYVIIFEDNMHSTIAVTHSCLISLVMGGIQDSIAPRIHCKRCVYYHVEYFRIIEMELKTLFELLLSHEKSP